MSIHIVVLYDQQVIFYFVYDSSSQVGGAQLATVPAMTQGFQRIGGSRWDAFPVDTPMDM